MTLQSGSVAVEKNFWEGFHGSFKMCAVPALPDLKISIWQFSAKTYISNINHLRLRANSGKSLVEISRAELHQRQCFHRGGLSRRRMWVSKPAPFVLNGNAEGKEISKHATRRTDLLRKAHLRFQGRKLVDRFSPTWTHLVSTGGGLPLCQSSFSLLELQSHLLRQQFLSAFLNFLRGGGGTDVLVCTEVYGRLRGTDRCGAGWRCCSIVRPRHFARCCSPSLLLGEPAMRHILPHSA